MIKSATIKTVSELIEGGYTFTKNGCFRNGNHEIDRTLLHLTGVRFNKVKEIEEDLYQLKESNGVDAGEWHISELKNIVMEETKEVKKMSLGDVKVYIHTDGGLNWVKSGSLDENNFINSIHYQDVTDCI